MMTVRMNCKTVKVGDVFGRLTVVGKPFRLGRKYHAVVECSCGVSLTVVIGSLKRGLTRSCGCLCSEKCSERSKTLNLSHGLTSGGQDKRYKIWLSMRRRCNVTQDPAYKYYGARGIKVCDEWINDPESFCAWATENGYLQGLQLDRIDNNGGYSPENCRWVTAAENSRNRRSNVNLTAFGETKCISEWARDERCGVSAKVLGKRIKNGWNHIQAITTGR